MNEQTNVLNLKNRMKARLALANFKLEHGYLNLDLRTLESNLYKDKLKSSIKSGIYKRKKIISTNHRFYPTSSSNKNNKIYIINKYNASLNSHIPLSDMRLHRKLSLTLSTADEDAAHLLVLMHHSPTL